MNFPKTSGESSCRAQENGDVSMTDERPHKKARFAWQIKGKCHLKSDISNSKISSVSLMTDSDSVSSSSESESSPSKVVGNTEQNLEILGDYLLKQDFNTLDSVIADSNSSLLKPSTSLSSENIPYPRYVRSYENNNSSDVGSTSSSTTEHLSVPMSMVVSENYSEDQCIARWQARQMAKGFVDNTINRVLDSWMEAPPVLIPYESHNRLFALDVAEYINNLPGHNVENEGILMAISAHGLQNTSGSSSNNTEQLDVISNLKDDDSTANSPLPSDDEVRETNKDDENMPWSRTNSEALNLFPDSISHYCRDTENVNDDVCDELNSIGEGADTSHFDFMDAAVSFAIQNKGLASFSSG